MKSTLSLLASLTMVSALSGSAMAQQSPANGPTTVTKEMHAAATNGGTVANGGGASVHSLLSASPSTSTVTLGWHFFHATNCEPYFDGVTTWVYVFGDGTFWFSNNLYFTTAMETQCALGNLMAVNVVNATTGAFNAEYTYNFK